MANTDHLISGKLFLSVTCALGVQHSPLVGAFQLDAIEPLFDQQIRWFLDPQDMVFSSSKYVQIWFWDRRPVWFKHHQHCIYLDKCSGSTILCFYAVSIGDSVADDWCDSQPHWILLDKCGLKENWIGLDWIEKETWIGLASGQDDHLPAQTFFNIFKYPSGKSE